MSARITKAEALRTVAEDAYEAASAGLGFAPTRMGGYAARRLAEVRFGIPADTISIDHRGDWGNALRTLAKTNPALAERLNFTKKARGRGFEPHTNAEVVFGTLEVEQYVRGWRQPSFGISTPQEFQGVSTFGPAGLYQGVLIVEKDGLLEFIRRAGIGPRYDLMIASSEGQGVEALKALIERFSQEGLPCYVLRDYDLAGAQIAAALSGRNTKSWRWKVKPRVVDLGIKFGDIAHWKIEDESVSGEDDWEPLLRDLGSSQEEIAYLLGETWIAPSERKNRRGKLVTHWRGRRAELNGLIGQTFIDYIEAKLDAQKLGKLVPSDEWLRQAYVRAVKVKRLNDEIENLVNGMADGEVAVPEDLRARVEQKLDGDRSRVWDLVVAGLAEEDNEEVEQ